MAKHAKNEHTNSDRGPVDPFPREAVDLIRRTLHAQKALRDLALFSAGIDMMLRGGDLVRLKVGDVRSPLGEYLTKANVRQGKTGKIVQVYPSSASIAALREMIEADGKWQSDYLFTATGQPHGEHITETTLRRLVKGWARIAHLDPARFSSHSLRRTRPTIIYAETRNVEVCRQLLGHASVAATSKYLNVTAAEVESVARRYEI